MNQPAGGTVPRGGRGRGGCRGGGGRRGRRGRRAGVAHRLLPGRGVAQVVDVEDPTVAVHARLPVCGNCVGIRGAP